MSAPLYKFGLFGDGFSLLIAFLIGIGFGYYLEQGGLGNSKKLVGQFYLTDFTVFKVMFTAIITAMTGLFYLSVMGIVDLSLVFLTKTYIIPQIIGGLVLGVGFVIGGYCPGTCLVGMTSGKTDGAYFLGGLFVGIFIFAELFPLTMNFFFSSPMERVTLNQFFDWSYGFTLFVVILMAIAGFVFFESIERKQRIGSE
ncbi:MAG: YeeE/YedE family protein [Calditrichaeota bacterium]|nr:YeeE/YedE family protein [Calditrichota bacterium]